VQILEFDSRLGECVKVVSSNYRRDPLQALDGLDQPVVNKNL
jgi:hypothetical protein